MKIPKLKPCAHCGSNSVQLARHVDVDLKVGWYVECIDCGIQTCLYDEACDCDATYESVRKASYDAIDCAVSAWNNRVEHASACDDNNHCDNNNDNKDDKRAKYTYDDYKRCADKVRHMNYGDLMELLKKSGVKFK